MEKIEIKQKRYFEKIEELNTEMNVAICRGHYPINENKYKEMKM